MIMKNLQKKRLSIYLKSTQKWGLKFDKLKTGKPSYHVLIDDKSFDFKKSWLKSFDLDLKRFLIKFLKIAFTKKKTNKK